MYEIEQKVGSRFHAGVEILQKGITQSAGSSGTGILRQVFSHSSGRFLGKPFGPFIQLADHFGCSPFLRTEDMRGSVRTVQRIANVASQCEMAFLQTTVRKLFYFLIGGKDISQSLKHSCSGIAGSASSQSDDEVTATLFYGMDDQFTDTVSRGEKRIAFFCSHESEAASPCRFDYRRTVSSSSITGADRAHQRIVSWCIYKATLQSRDKSFEHSFPSVRHGQGYDFGTLLLQSAGKCFFYLLRTEAPLE